MRYRYLLRSVTYYTFDLARLSDLYPHFSTILVGRLRSKRIYVVLLLVSLGAEPVELFNLKPALCLNSTFKTLLPGGHQYHLLTLLVFQSIAIPKNSFTFHIYGQKVSITRQVTSKRSDQDKITGVKDMNSSYIINVSSISPLELAFLASNEFVSRLWLIKNITFAVSTRKKNDMQKLLSMQA
ncbi:hypothetical protein EYC80_005732 [Monilinia laxa]|uniref:Uncharacterized protein n=1 Tax=Monilinia laxa TaxID=61186 RepID=A0A5N6KEY0_MONLA|nr:hypothetical protein EYC80_005732 [Monilinia laxa]